MTLLQSIVEFFQSIFMASSPEVKKRQALRKIENDLKNSTPVLYKNEMVQVNFAETLRVLCINTKPIGDLLAETICSEDLNLSRRYEEQLLFTGFDAEAKDILSNMEYDRRKEGARNAQSVSRFLESEHRQLEKVVRQLNSPDFLKIDAVINKIKQLNDICKYSYVTALRLFDSNFSPIANYSPSFSYLSADLLETSLMDLYYVLAGMDITVSLNKAVLALAQLKNGGELSPQAANSLTGNLKKIQNICKNIFTKTTLINLIRIAKKDPDFTPGQASYQTNQRQQYADYLENRFHVDESRLKNELQDEKIISQVHALFGDKQLLYLSGYGQGLNDQLKQSTPCSFSYVLPVQVLKTFITDFYENGARILLNDIVIEGFFNNPVYKSEFSAIVFACNEAVDRIAEFEQLFTRGGEFDEAIIVSLIHDSHKEASLVSQLKATVDKANKRAKDLLQTEANNIFALSKKITDIILESKKPSSDVITNLKMLMISSRNRASAEQVEKQEGLLKIFLEIMKNYVIIGNIDKK